METSWTSSGSPDAESDPSSSRHCIFFTLGYRIGGDEGGDDDDDEGDDDELDEAEELKDQKASREERDEQDQAQFKRHAEGEDTYELEAPGPASHAASIRIADLDKLSMIFQGGYSAQGVVLSARIAERNGPGGWAKIAEAWPQDSNAKQEFPWVSLPRKGEQVQARSASTDPCQPYRIRPVAPSDVAEKTASQWKLELNGSADSFGRVTLYGVELWARR